jgi:hypothetical protein
MSGGTSNQVLGRRGRNRALLERQLLLRRARGGGGKGGEDGVEMRR